MRSFKKKKAYCPNKSCLFTSRGKGQGGFDTEVQREVDIAIAIRPVKAYREHPTMKTFILLAGDGDFTDMLKFVKTDLGLRVILVAWSQSVNGNIPDYVSETYYLDNIFDQISEPNIGNKDLTN